jgi:hypothetical protein
MKRALEGATSPASKKQFDPLGKSIQIEKNGQWVKASVTDYRPDTNEAKIFYDHENVEETVNLNDANIKWVDAEQLVEPQQPAQSAGFAESDFMEESSNIYPSHPDLWEQDISEQDLASSAILRMERLGKESGVKLMTPEEHQKWFDDWRKQKQEISRKKAPKAAESGKRDELKVYNVELKWPSKSKALPSFYSYRDPVSNKEFNRLRDLEMHVGWSRTCVVVPVNWKGFNPPQEEVLPGRGLPFACPFAGCNRGAHSQQEIQEHICRHHDISDPTKPKSGKIGPLKKLRRREEVPKDPLKSPEMSLEFFKEYVPPGHECQADAMVKYFVKKILCAAKGAEPEELPPRPAQPLNLPHMELSSPDPSWFVQDIAPPTQQDYYEVEAVLSDRTNEQTGDPEYLVKWKGYDEPTWEPARVIAHLPMYSDYLENRQLNLENSETFGATTSFQTEDSIVKTEGLFETTDTTIAQLPDVNFEGNFV